MGMTWPTGLTIPFFMYGIVLVMLLSFPHFFSASNLLYLAWLDVFGQVAFANL